MEFRLLNVSIPHSAAFTKLLIISVAFAPVLTVQNSNSQPDDHPLLQCTVAVSRCLFNYGWNISDTKCSDQNHMTNTRAEDNINLISELRATYGNITERLDGLSKPQPELLQNIKDLSMTLQTFQDLSNNKKLWDLTASVETLKSEIKSIAAAQKGTEELILSQKQLIECRENLSYSQRSLMQLKECNENLGNLQHAEKQLIECEETLTAFESDMNGLRLLVHERYKEYDVVSAVRQNDLNKLRLLLDAGMRVDSRDKNSYNNTALHVACLGGHLDLIRFLVKRGAPLEARNTDKNTPLIDAVAGNQLPAVQLMIELGADPLARGWNGETPQGRAVRSGYVEVAKWLKDNGW